MPKVWQKRALLTREKLQRNILDKKAVLTREKNKINMPDKRVSLIVIKITDFVIVIKKCFFN